MIQPDAASHLFSQSFHIRHKTLGKTGIWNKSEHTRKTWHHPCKEHHLITQILSFETD